MTPPTTPLPESSHLERLSSGGNLLTSGWMNHTRPPLLTTRGHPLGIPSSGEDFNTDEKCTLRGECMSRCLADARWKRMWNHRLAYSGLFRLIPAYSGLFRLIPAYSGLFVDAVHVSIWIRDRLHIVPKKRPPRLLRCRREHPWHSYHQGGTFECRATPYKSIIRPNVYHNNSTKRSETFGP